MFDMSCVKFKDTPFHPNKSNFESTNPKYKELCYNKEKSHRFHIFELFIRDNAAQQSRSYRGKPDDFFTSVGNKLSYCEGGGGNFGAGFDTRERRGKANPRRLRI